MTQLLGRTKGWLLRCLKLQQQQELIDVFADGFPQAVPGSHEVRGEDERSQSTLTEVTDDGQRGTPLRALSGDRDARGERKQGKATGRAAAVGLVPARTGENRRNAGMSRKDWPTSLEAR